VYDGGPEPSCCLSCNQFGPLCGSNEAYVKPPARNP
jgi:hypothetical protein